MGLRLFERRRVRSAGDRKRLGRFLLHDFTGGRHRGNQQSRYPDATRRIYPGYGKTLRLEISSGIGTVASYDVMSDYDQPLLQAGDYQADFSYGNPDTEGENAGCFKGNQTIYRRGAQDHDRAGFAVAGQLGLFAELFRMVQAILYRLRPDRPHRIGLPVGLFGSTAKPLTGTLPVFVKAATKLFLSGSATKTNGVKVEFPETEIGTTAARTWHTILLDAGAVGQASITVSLDDSPIEIKEVDVELNPDA